MNKHKHKHTNKQSNTNKQTKHYTGPETKQLMQFIFSIMETRMHPEHTCAVCMATIKQKRLRRLTPRAKATTLCDACADDIGGDDWQETLQHMMQNWCGDTTK